MISSLINMKPNVVTKSIPAIQNTDEYTITDYATVFIEGLGKSQKARFKMMLECGMQCGMSVAANYNVDYDEFISEVKRLLKVGVENE